MKPSVHFHSHLPRLHPLLVGISLSLFSLEGKAQTPAPCPTNPNYTYTVGCNLGRNEDKNLEAGQTLYIPAGITYTGKVNVNGGNNATSTIYNYGTWEPNDNLNLAGTTTLYNFETGRLILRSVNLNQATTRLFNLGTLNISQNLSAGGFIRNAATGTINAAASNGITINSGGLLDNLGTINTSDYINNDRTTNCGTIRVLGKNGGFTNNGSGVVVNTGTINTDGDFTNNGNIQGSTTGGAGLVRVGAGSTSAQNASGTFGISPTGTPSRLDLCDADRPAGGWDRRNGRVSTSVTYCATTTPAGCANTNNPLPVELLHFEAKLAQGSVLLSWSTASEKNNNKFVLERSTDGESFEAVTEVAGHGTSSNAHSYSATDASPLPGTSYYRLRQLDFDGTATYSPVASILNAADNLANKLSIHPNPTADYVTLDLPNAADETTYEVRISMLSGQLVRHTTLKRGETQLDLRALPAGTYLIQVQSANTQMVQRLIKR